MFFSFSITSCTLALPIVVVLIGTASVTGVEAAPVEFYCPTATGGNTSGNAFLESNRNSLLTFIVSTATTTAEKGYGNRTDGSSPNEINGLIQCVGEIGVSQCQSCMDTATEEITTYCPSTSSAYVWYDECLLRYSTDDFLSKVDTTWRVFVNSTASEDGTYDDRFDRSVSKLMTELAPFAAYNTSDNSSESSSTYYATGTLESDPKVYGMVQCTRDLPSGEDCNKCLDLIVQDLPKCCSGKKRGRIFTGSCNLRYDTDIFFKDTLLVVNGTVDGNGTVVDGNGTVETAANPTKRTGINKGLIIGILVPVILVGLLVILVCSRQQLFKYAKFEHSSNEDTTQEDSKAGIQPPWCTTLLKEIEESTTNFAQNEIGAGSNGCVYKAHCSQWKDIAVKVVKDDNSEQSRYKIKQLKNEAALLDEFRHDNIIKYYTTFRKESETEKEEYLVCELMTQGSIENILRDVERRKNDLKWDRRYNIIKDIAKALQYLHVKNIIHLDVKPGNILLDEKFKAKLADFGTSVRLHDDQTENFTPQQVGTAGYMAPEISLLNAITKECDVYSFGVFVLEMLKGECYRHIEEAQLLQEWVQRMIRDPTRNQEERMRNIIDNFILTEEYPQNEADICHNLISDCTEDEPKDRPTMSDVVRRLQ